MLYLLLSIICSVLLGFAFKLYPRFGVHTFTAIVVNYFVCVACATLHRGSFPIAMNDFSGPWMPYSLLLGGVFITGFYAAALTVQHFSVTLSQIMQKMSILLTVPFAILVYGESSGILKIIGVVCALAAIILVNWPEKKIQNSGAASEGLAQKMATWMLFVPIITWVLSAVIEVVFVTVEGDKLITFGDNAFVTAIFGTAGILGLAALLVLLFLKKVPFPTWRTVLGGVALGIPNYGSIYFILMALGSGLEGSFFFPVNNLGIILTTAIAALLFFGDRFTPRNWLGLGFAVLAILLMAF